MSEFSHTRKSGEAPHTPLGTAFDRPGNTTIECFNKCGYRVRVKDSITAHTMALHLLHDCPLRHDA